MIVFIYQHLNVQLRVWVLFWDYKTLHIKLCSLINMKLYVNAAVIIYAVTIYSVTITITLLLFTLLQFFFLSDSDKNEAGEVSVRVSTDI